MEFEFAKMSAAATVPVILPDYVEGTIPQVDNIVDDDNVWRALRWKIERATRARANAAGATDKSDDVPCMIKRTLPEGYTEQHVRRIMTVLSKEGFKARAHATTYLALSPPDKRQSDIVVTRGDWTIIVTWPAVSHKRSRMCEETDFESDSN